MTAIKLINKGVPIGILIVMLICTVLIYTTDQSNSFIATYARIADLPAESLNSHLIGFGEIYSQFNAIRLSPEAGAMTRDGVMKAVMNKIRREYAARDLAKDINALPPRNAMRSLVDDYMSRSFDTNAAILPLIRPLTLSQFKRYMIEPIIIEQQIAKKIILDEENDVYLHVKQFYDQANADPTRFDNLYTQYASEQNLTSTSTDQILSAEDLSPNDSTMLRSITEGHVTPVIASYDGYRIYKILHYFTDPQEAWQVQELFMPVSIEERINQYLNDQHIVQFAPHALGTAN